MAWLSVPEGSPAGDSSHFVDVSPIKKARSRVAVSVLQLQLHTFSSNQQKVKRKKWNANDLQLWDEIQQNKSLQQWLASLSRLVRCEKPFFNPFILWMSSLRDVTLGTGTFLRVRGHTHQPQAGSALWKCLCLSSPNIIKVCVLTEGCKHRAKPAASKWFLSFFCG